MTPDHSIEKIRSTLHRWSSKDPLLPLRRDCLELLRRLPHEDVGDFRSQREHFRQSILPSVGGAGLNHYIESYSIRHPTGPILGFLFLFPRSRHSHQAHHGALSPAVADRAHGSSRSRHWHHCLFPDHPLSRPALLGSIWSATIDVLYARYHSAFQIAGSIPLDYAFQSHDSGN